MLSELKKTELASVVGAFITKRSVEGTFRKIIDYPFEVLGWKDVVINPCSINQLDEGWYSFNGKAIIIRHDPVSGVSEEGVESEFYGNAFYCPDNLGNPILLRVTIDNLKS